ncbi:hypothetical protein IM793_22820 [Pedobacter sp. MR2016-19]|uniref:hypothetical protein n=1 Tax=Pedobacter sp. MR2016-19 TaxID=2780089 RepID=UPI0018742317|nr:hypothetical protein [Pedobacter sp. MR2016-19]MBE5322006.1 hypothetical protein [Pedobacter sp. MR2016-19]
MSKDKINEGCFNRIELNAGNLLKIKRTEKMHKPFLNELMFYMVEILGIGGHPSLHSGCQKSKKEALSKRFTLAH